MRGGQGAGHTRGLGRRERLQEDKGSDAGGHDCREEGVTGLQAAH
jgi:hypothetical protein